MIGLGAYFQFKVQRPAVKNLGGAIGAGVFGFGENLLMYLRKGLSHLP